MAAGTGREREAKLAHKGEAALYIGGRGTVSDARWMYIIEAFAEELERGRVLRVTGSDQRPLQAVPERRPVRRAGRGTGRGLWLPGRDRRRFVRARWRRCVLAGGQHARQSSHCTEGKELAALQLFPERGFFYSFF